ncbi:MAG: hypothetical protein J6K76_03615, partial [Spirochaetaceae bacterium]|nr:hypothetical protein [Spirochaetaceae bacterium]
PPGSLPPRPHRTDGNQSSYPPKSSGKSTAGIVLPPAECPPSIAQQGKSGKERGRIIILSKMNLKVLNSDSVTPIVKDRCEPKSSLI